MFKAEDLSEKLEKASLDEYKMTKAELAYFGVIVSGKRANIQKKILEVAKKNAF